MKWGRQSNMVVGSKNHGLLVTMLVLVFFSQKCLGSRKANWDVVPPGCMNCTICPYACHPLNPPPPSLDYPTGGVPPPPPVLPYPSDVVPPPPPPPPPLNCTTVPVQCCQYPTSGTTPTITPPVGYGYQPVDNNSASLSPVHFISVMVLLFSIVALL
ncbi:unnamed protein product [Linum trigynum]|uniref:Uncharacterized protein n=1 Tax=Linum trigynum TaxID=586398 RepID=A0AAV2CCA9_9ROSI